MRRKVMLLAAISPIAIALPIPAGVPTTGNGRHMLEKPPLDVSPGRILGAPRVSGMARLRIDKPGSEGRDALYSSRLIRRSIAQGLGCN